MRPRVAYSHREEKDGATAKGKGKVRTIVLTIRLREDEAREIKQAVSKSKLSQSEWARNALIAAARGDSV